MFDFITIGGATIDITFVTNKGRIIETPENLTEQRMLAFEYGAKIKSDKTYTEFGGGACNAGASLSKLGFDVAVLCCVGGEELGKSIVANLQNRNIDTSLVQVDHSKSSALSLVVLNPQSDGDRVIFTSRGASDSLRIDEEELGKTSGFYVTGLGKGWKKNLSKICDIIQQRGVRLFWNPGLDEIRGGKAQLLELMQLTEVLIVNKDEAIELLHKDSTANLNAEQLNDVTTLIKFLKEWGAKIVVITDGANGAWANNGERIIHAEAFCTQKVDTTGAGDAFGSSFAGGYCLTTDFEDALRFGIINSGHVIQEPGAQNGLLTRSEIEELLEKVVIEYIN